ncbi:hypothetical protein LTR17_011633 [Elasticomyces elasticus]|nr:hypothetical protein LTR17_011633 [Elasticomyces elasticus]
MSLSDLQGVYADQDVKRNQQCIRLLRLSSGVGDEPINCHLYTVELDNAGCFEALSYVWGTSIAERPVLVDGKPCAVTENLLTALVNLRRPDSDRTLWVDSICINQKNVLERNDQVQKMGSIYGHAQRVLVWLGLATEASQEAFDFLFRSYQNSPRNRVELMEDQGWIAMKDLYQRMYWTRVWIVQEVALAKQAVLVCGHTELPWRCVSELRKARNHIWPQNLSSGESDFRRSTIARLDDVRVRSRKETLDMWSLLESFPDLQCYDIHDKIYGFLGLANDCSNAAIPVDYSNSVQQLFEDVVRFRYQKFQKDATSPHAAQLMKLCEFLQNYLRGRQHYRDSIGQAQRFEDAQAHPACLSISASALLVISGVPTQDQACELGAPNLLDFLSGSKPYSYLSFWREKVDSSLSTICAVDAPKAHVALHMEVEQKADGTTQPFDRASAIVATCLNSGSTSGSAHSTSQVIGIAPPGIHVGDLVCTFVDSQVALIIRRTPDRSSIYKLVGRAELDLQRLEEILPIKIRLAHDKSIETTIIARNVERLARWPATFSLDLSTLKAVTAAVARQRVHGQARHRVELMPDPQTLPKLSTFSDTFRNFDASQRRKFEQDPHHARLLRAPATGISNNGSVGYANCAFQILYHLKPFREAILGVFHDSIASALQDLFRRLEHRGFPVSASVVFEAFGWNSRQVFESQDFFEFWRLLVTKLIKVPGLSWPLETLLVGKIWESYRESRKQTVFQGSYLLCSDAQGSISANQLQDYTIDTRNTTSFLQSMREACRPGDGAGRSVPSDRLLEFMDVPPILIVQAVFHTSNHSTGRVDMNEARFAYPSSFDFADVAKLGDVARSDSCYELHGVIVLEATPESSVWPEAKWMLYFRPSKEDNWFLFFNDSVTTASKQEVFEDLFIRGRRNDFLCAPLRTPTGFIFLKSSMVETLLY